MSGYAALTTITILIKRHRSPTEQRKQTNQIIVSLYISLNGYPSYLCAWFNLGAMRPLIATF